MNEPDYVTEADRERLRHESDRLFQMIGALELPGHQTLAVLLDIYRLKDRDETMRLAKALDQKATAVLTGIVKDGVV